MNANIFYKPVYDFPSTSHLSSTLCWSITYKHNKLTDSLLVQHEEMRILPVYMLYICVDLPSFLWLLPLLWVPAHPSDLYHLLDPGLPETAHTFCQYAHFLYVSNSHQSAFHLLSCPSRDATLALETHRQTDQSGRFFFPSSEQRKENSITIKHVEQAKLIWLMVDLTFSWTSHLNYILVILGRILGQIKC